MQQQEHLSLQCLLIVIFEYTLLLILGGDDHLSMKEPLSAGPMLARSCWPPSVMLHHVFLCTSAVSIMHKGERWCEYYSKASN